jgi:phage FluMu protein Com
MEEIRCRRCQKLLLKAVVVYGEIKCQKCGYVQNIRCGKASNDVKRSVIKEVAAVVA